MIDSHCHIAGEEFTADLAAIASRAQAAGVAAALCILEAEEASEVGRAEAVQNAWPSVQFAAGVHPHHAGKFAGNVDAGIEVVRAAARTVRACGIGEIGLDYHYDFSPRDAQEEMFRAQIRLARELELPIIIHTREATADTFRIIREEGGSAVGGVFHCFTGDAAMARDALDLGFYLSYAGILTFPKAGDVREAARITPRDRLLSETDAPYLAPTPHRGKRNEPAFVVRVVETLAELHGIGVSDMDSRISENFVRLFGPRPRRGQAP